MSSIKKDFKIFFSKYSEQDPVLRTLDLYSLAGVVIFAVLFLLSRIIDVTTSPANAITLIAPLLIAGLIFAFRSKLSEDKVDSISVAKSFLTYAGGLFIIILIPVLWTL